MKSILPVFALLMLFAVSDAWSDEEKKEMMKPYAGSAEFERVKSLAGKWRGSMDGMEMEVEYTVVAGGSAVMERTFPGTPMEMITLYHDKGGKLALTHYCMLQNRPHLVQIASDDKSIALKLDENGEVDAKKESHMHSLVLTFVNDQEIEQLWTHYVDGKAQEPHAMKFKRVKKGEKNGSAGEEVGLRSFDRLSGGFCYGYHYRNDVDGDVFGAVGSDATGDPQASE